MRPDFHIGSKKPIATGIAKHGDWVDGVLHANTGENINLAMDAGAQAWVVAPRVPTGPDATLRQQLLTDHNLEYLDYAIMNGTGYSSIGQRRIGTYVMGGHDWVMFDDNNVPWQMRAEFYHHPIGHGMDVTIKVIKPFWFKQNVPDLNISLGTFTITPDDMSDVTATDIVFTTNVGFVVIPSRHGNSVLIHAYSPSYHPVNGSEPATRWESFFAAGEMRLNQVWKVDISGAIAWGLDGALDFDVASVSSGLSMNAVKHLAHSGVVTSDYPQGVPMDHWQALADDQGGPTTLVDDCTKDGFEQHLCVTEDVTLYPPTLHPNGVGERYTTDVIVGHRQDAQNGFEPVAYHFEREKSLLSRTAALQPGQDTEYTYEVHRRVIGDTWPLPCVGSQPSIPWADTCWPEYGVGDASHYWVKQGGAYTTYDNEETLLLTAGGVSLEVIDRDVTEGDRPNGQTAAYHEFTSTLPGIAGPVALEIVHYSGTALFAELAYTAGGTFTVMFKDDVSLQSITPQKVSRHPETGAYLFEPTAADGVQWL